MENELFNEALNLLKNDYELGIYTYEEYTAELQKLGVNTSEQPPLNYSLIGSDGNKHIKIYNYTDLIQDNLKPISKIVLENKWGQRNVNEDKIIIVKGKSPESENIYSITYINRFGQFIEIDLNDIVSYLDKIDLD